MPTLVLDTNIVLDLFVFDDPRCRPLKAELDDGRWRWLATQRMRDELERVLDYAHLAARMASLQLEPAHVLAAFDRHASIVEAPAKAPVTCSDPDDQMFIDLAVAHRCLLLSKDAAVLSMKKRLALLGVDATTALPACSA